MFNWFSKKRADKPSSKTVLLGEALIPDGQVVYAVGDIHGRADLLRAVIEKIDRDEVPTGSVKTVVYLGDYVDRGPESKAVIDLLIASQKAGARQHVIMGNHEEFLMRFLDDPVGSTSWLTYGGAETLLSYGVGMPPGVMTPEKLAKAAEDLLDKLDESGHLGFYRALEDAVVFGDYYFTHAGINPDQPIDQQTGESLRWIREPFLGHMGGYSHIVVHGHTITEEPVFRPNRIGIDTGAYHSGNLTCLRLEQNSYSIL
ncbi:MULTISPECIES: metallophosphoesterase family protein [Thalassospira]|uniref:Metallophosphoesterase family protein n=1 Tax=Thalassospira aquimaris TaxID=3037796 RepID=A0ABT6GDS7_9PROT|nr:MULTISPECIES: metallophosphoesterase family protein [Thalassospira]MDG4720108.1 metallophosphoesterase family protein [Thalassospira sp. FZY0004]